MKWFLPLLVAVTTATCSDLPPSCDKPVYCDSKLLSYVQLGEVYNDSKEFVDKQMRNSPTTTLTAFEALLNQTNNEPSNEQLKEFVDEYFESNSELENWTPNDYSTDPAFLGGIKDTALRQFGRNINAIWPDLGRKVKQVVFDKPDQYSLIPVSHGFIIPGGRFKELYYWDSYWIVEGLLISEMHSTVKGMIENLIELLNTVGHIPNGGRWYYQERSQPPLLTAMVSQYLLKTNDIEFVRTNIDSLEKEIYYWLDSQIFTFDKGDRTYTLLRYYAQSAGPRPESYREDYNNAEKYFDTQERREEFYTDLKSAAESGWDFSSRWFIDQNGSNTGHLSNIHTKDIIPVDLNSIFANALQNLARFQALLGNPHRAAHWAYLSKQWMSSIEEVFWNENDGMWYDYDMANNKHRQYFYPSNLAPLWMGAVEKPQVKAHTPRLLDYLRVPNRIDFPGGVPSSLNDTGEQWDFPNAWPPLVSIVVNALEALGSDEGNEMAFEVAQTWVRACHKGFTDNKQMFEKYDARQPGVVGGGGEYNVQEGFGWSNGVVLEFLAKYGRSLTAYDSIRETQTGLLEQVVDQNSGSHTASEEVPNVSVIGLMKQRLGMVN